ncbi:MAG TPA: SDR family NAD(P)-dependent oxidoreductase [Pyrinomonadaceae bacterium]|nr:SDR family NAD(P)-dependent oxidoreductase [Pyrinomonadaceae bacterium]
MPGQSFRGFAEKVAVVTGGGRGVGRAVALSLALEGAYVIVAYAPGDAGGANVSAELRDVGTLAHAVETDVSGEDDVKKLFDTVGETYGRLDLLVNAASLCRAKPLAELTAADWDRAVGVSLKGAFLAARAALPLMRGRPGAAIVNVCSEVGLTGRGGGAAYVSAEAGVVGLTKALARELAPRVRVNCVAVGGAAALEDVGGRNSVTAVEGDERSVTAVKDFTADTLLGRPPAADEAARACLYLLSPDARSITGETLVVGGSR